MSTSVRKLTCSWQWVTTATIIRRTYFLGGHAIATRITGDPTNNGLFYLHGDHLGSTSLLTYGSSPGNMVPGTETRYLPYGTHRLAPTTQLTERDYTGQKENLELGLLYYNARFYLPGIGRFASADTIVPDPNNPQQFNRYTYGLNNALRFNDPTGHCSVGDTDCWTLADQLYQQYGWYLDGLASHGTWTVAEVQILLDAALKIELWFARLGGGDAQGRMRAALGGTSFVKGGVISEIALGDRHHVRGSTIHLVTGFDTYWVVHEIGHVFDNRAARYPYAALFGGGLADDMSRRLEGNPTMCVNRSDCPDYAMAVLKEDFPSEYAKKGPSEDFAETFRLSVLSPGSLGRVRSEFMVEMGHSLVTSVGEFQGSPYSSLQRYGQGYVAPPGYGGGVSFPIALFQ